MKKTALLLFAYLSCMMSIKAQDQHEMVWAFGYGAGIDFKTEPPTAIGTNIRTMEGTASISDREGNLLFYTDGYNVWNRNHDIMPNGRKITGTADNATESTVQGALIVPMPRNHGQYYIFSMGALTGGALETDAGKLFYSVVDIASDSGRGDVVRKGLVLDSLLTEHMTAVSGNDCNVWLLALTKDNALFKAYNIGMDGIDPSPKISTCQGKDFVGSISVASDRKRLAIARENLIVYDFSPDSGTITNPLVLSADTLSRQYYGACFSPNNTKLYATNMEHYSLEQFDLSLDDQQAIVASKTTFPGIAGAAIQKAPNGKLYIARWRSNDNNYLGVVNYPDLPGAACQFVMNGFKLLRQCKSGLPNVGAIIIEERLIYHSIADTRYCSGPLQLTASEAGGQDYFWNDSARGPIKIVDQPGTYWLHYRVPVNTACRYDYHIDTFKVGFRRFTSDQHSLTHGAGLCKADTLSLQAKHDDGNSYTWADGIIGRHRKVNTPGVYRLQYRIDSLCENHVDSFVIQYPDPEYRVSFQADTVICQLTPVTLKNTSNSHFNKFTWFFGDQNFSTLPHPEHIYRSPGIYRLTLAGNIDGICADTAYQTIVVDSLFPLHLTTNPDTICSGGSISLETNRDSTLAKLYWQWGDGNEFRGTQENSISHAYDRAGVFTIMLTKRYRACPDATITDTVVVHPIPPITLGNDSTICLNGASIALFNQSDDPLLYQRQWNTGDTSATILIRHPGRYTLDLWDKATGCRASGSIIVHKDCHIDIPNAFTPNGDGHNDYFFPHRLLAMGFRTFQFRILNRWGQILFETRSVDGRGWDGNYNIQPQPPGVYLYQIQIDLDNNTVEQYQGNVTLLR